MFGNKKSVQFLQRCKQEKKDIVVVSVLTTEGSAYRKSGAMMLVDSDGTYLGVVSGGCFEEEVIHCCREVLASRKGKYVTHDMRMKDDSPESWGQGVGCNGLLKFWMEPFYHEEAFGVLAMALESALNNENKILLRSLEDAKGHRLVLEGFEGEARYLEEKKLFYQKIRSPYRLLVLGAGPGCESLVSIADTQGWISTVADTRQSHLKHVHTADQQYLLHTAAEADALCNKGFDAIVIMSHVFNSDSDYMKAALHSDAAYIGIMGPKKRTQMLIQSIGLPEETVLDARIHNPVGLELGGETPESIALAICAQIEAMRNRRSAVSQPQEKLNSPNAA